MSDQSQADISAIKKFNAKGAPSKAKLRTIMSFLGVVYAGAPVWGCGGLWLFWQTGLSNWWLWLFMPLGFAVVIASFILVIMVEGEYKNYYKKVMRGVVTHIDPNQTQVYVDGYTWTNLRLQQWKDVSPTRWRDAKVGDVIDFSPVNLVK